MNFDDITFRRSSFCGSSACLEVGRLPDGRVAVRDTVSGSSRHLVFDDPGWAAFIRGVKASQFGPGNGSVS